jgi:hypothetical protein
VGYHTLAVGHVTLDDAPERLTKGLTKHPVPIMRLARLATVHRWQGKGVGKAVLRDAMQRTLQAADIAGIRALAFMQKTRKRGASTNISISPPPLPAPCTCSFSTKRCAGSTRNNRPVLQHLPAAPIRKSRAIESTIAGHPPNQLPQTSRKLRRAFRARS